MEQEKKDRSIAEGKVDNLTEPSPHSDSVEAQDATTESLAEEKRTSGGNPGRMIMTGVITAAILAVIAVVVAGVFQVTSRWLIVCPQDLPVNDPAPILWKHMTSTEPAPTPLGVPQALSMETRLKGTTSTPDSAQ